MDENEAGGHYRFIARVATDARLLFDFLDDPARLGAHMQKSWMLAGAGMAYRLDASRGRAPGAVIRMTGSVLGLPLSVEEVVTEREPPSRKTWHTIGEPRLLVIGAYRMGFRITPHGDESVLEVFIDYALPRSPGKWLAGLYARWCVRRMALDAARHFSPPGDTA